MGSPHATSPGRPTAPDRDQAQGLLGVAAAAIMWGSIPLFARWSGAAPFVTVFWRVTFASAALLVYVLLRGQLKLLPHVGRRTLLGLVLVGILLAVAWAALFTAFTWTTVATAVLVNYIGPVFVAAFAPLATHVSSDRRIILPLVVALAGTATIVGPQALNATGSRNLFGVLLAFASAILYALTVLITKRLLAGVPAGLVAFTQQAVATIVLLPAVFLLPGPKGAAGWGSVAALGVVHTGFAVLLFFSGLRVVRADHVAVLSYIEPVAAVIFAALFLAEPVRWYTVLGGAAVIAGGIMVARLGAVPSPESPALPPPAVGGATEETQACERQPPQVVSAVDPSATPLRCALERKTRSGLQQLDPSRHSAESGAPLQNGGGKAGYSACARTDSGRRQDWHSGHCVHQRRRALPSILVPHDRLPSRLYLLFEQLSVVN